MAKIPAPKQRGGCVEYMGMTVCPHVVYLTKSQRRTVHKMHRDNVAKVKKLEKTAKGGKKKRSSKA
jgi:hypothetical protein